MIIIYYRDADGKIVYHHKASEEMTLPEIGDAVREYNRTKKNGRTAYIFDAKESDLTAYLFQKAQERAKRDREALQEAISAIEDALDTVRGLEV